MTIRGNMQKRRVNLFKGGNMEEPEQPPKKSALDSCLITFAVLFVLALLGFVLMIENIKQQLTMH
jgi:hypothetical protein